MPLKACFRAALPGLTLAPLLLAVSSTMHWGNLAIRLGNNLLVLHSQAMNADPRS